MANITENKGPLTCTPKYKAWSKPGNKQLFQPRRRGLAIEPGNPAYEGQGYPAAGYGQTRKQVVKLAIPKVKMADGHMATVGTRISTQGTLNPNSSTYVKTTVLGLLSSGCQCSAIDHAFVHGVHGLGMAEKVVGSVVGTAPAFNRRKKKEKVNGLAGLSWLGQDLTTVQQLADAITTHAVPNSLLNRIAEKIIGDEKSNAIAYDNIAKLRALDPRNSQLDVLTRAQEASWGETNIAKFYALLIPEMQSRIVGKVTPPDYAYIKAAANPGVFSKIADMIREKVVGDAAQNLISAGYMKDSSLHGLGILPFVIAGVSAALVAAGIYAFLQVQNAKLAESNSRAALLNACATGTITRDACTAAISTLPKSTDTDWGDVAKWAGLGIGGLVLLQVISSIRSAFPTR